MGVKCKYKTLSEHGFLYVVDKHFEDYQTLPIFFQAKSNRRIYSRPSWLS